MAIYYGDENGKAQEIVVVGMQGPAGPQGPQGEPGPQGPTGQGVPEGGSPGQVLVEGENGPEWTPLIKTSNPKTVEIDGDWAYIRMNSGGAIFKRNEDGLRGDAIGFYTSGASLEGKWSAPNPTADSKDTAIATKGYVDSRIQASTEDLEAGTSPLETGKIYLVYE